ncbi:MAG: helix-turn-helix transcriptional regulator [Clostridia bacterium]|nr:helix-turn-helix transcriptional regulator [Clostridia bacterium]
MLNMESFGRRLTELRQHSGKLQREIAFACHVSVQAVSKWERGLSCPDILILDDLATVLGVSIQDLFDSNSSKSR